MNALQQLTLAGSYLDQGMSRQGDVRLRWGYLGFRAGALEETDYDNQCAIYPKSSS